MGSWFRAIIYNRLLSICALNVVPQFITWLIIRDIIRNLQELRVMVLLLPTSRLQMTIDTLNEKEKELFTAIEKSNTDEAISLIKSGVSVNCHDSSQMTPLSSAAYKGLYEVVSCCLENGADVNDKQHEHGYTALMFAGLSGKPDICKLLMDCGAKSYVTNTIGKTAGELAAFVGQHECVSIINNHICVDEIEKFLHPKGDASEEKYPEELVIFIHDLCKSHRVHPVAIIFRLSEYEDAMKYKKKILYVVDRVFEKQLRSKESNEVMSLKLWLILFTLREVIKHIDEQKDKPASEVALLYAKYVMAMEPGEQVRKNLETLLRNAIRSFPYHQSLLFETMVKAISKVEFGNRPSAYDFIIQGLFGQRILACSKFCATCGTPAAAKRCPKCKLSYCSLNCQKFDWPIHKKCCDSIKEWNLPEQEGDEMTIDDVQAQIQNIDI